MSKVEDYFFCNNLEIIGFKKVYGLTRFNTDEGQFIKNEYGHLYKESENFCERVV